MCWEILREFRGKFLKKLPLKILGIFVDDFLLDRIAGGISGEIHEGIAGSMHGEFLKVSVEKSHEKSL